MLEPRSARGSADERPLWLRGRRARGRRARPRSRRGRAGRARPPSARRRAPRARSRGGSPCASRAVDHDEAAPRLLVRTPQRVGEAVEHTSRPIMAAATASVYPTCLLGPRLAAADRRLRRARARARVRHAGLRRGRGRPARRRAGRAAALAEHHDGPGEVLFASKAFPCTAVLRVFAEEGLGCDVASGGELHLALQRRLRPRADLRPRQRQGRTPSWRRPSTPAWATWSSTTSTTSSDSSGSSRAGERQAVLRARHAGRRARHPPRDRHRPRTTRSSASPLGAGRGDARARRRVGSRRALRACTCTSARSCSTSTRCASAVAVLATLEPLRRLRPRRRPRRRLHARGPPAGDRGVGRVRRAAHCDELLGPGQHAAARARPRAGRERRRDALPVESVKRAARPVGRASTAACPTTCARCSTARATRRRSPTAWTSAASRARWPASTASPATCWCDDAHLPDPRPGDVARHAGHRRLRARDGQQLQRRPAPAGDLLLRRRRARASCAARPTRTCVPETFRVGLLGHGTVGAAFARLLEERADAIEPVTGLRPELSRRADALARRLRGDPRGLRPDRRADGRHRARARVRAARDARRASTSSRPTSSCSPQHGEELWATAREHGVQLRFEGAVAGVVPVIRVLQESLAAAHVERVHGIVNGTTNYILTEMARGGPVLRGGARAGAGARLRRGRPDRGRHRQGRRGQDGDPRPAGLLDPGAPRPGRLRGHRAHHRRRHRLRAASSGWR